MHQTLAPAEVIIVDGGSTDGTWERLESARLKYPTLLPIRDESCSLQRSPGPIARGRNVAVAAASSDVIAFTDAGCTHSPDWLANLTAPIFKGDSEYSVGGSYIDLATSTVWDVASAPFFGVKLNPEAATKSCTARSMAFRKELWQRVGGFPETVFLGEDTVFDVKVREIVTPCFPGTRQGVLPASPHLPLRSPADGQLFRNRWRSGRTLGPPVAKYSSMPRRTSCRSSSLLLTHSVVVRARTRSVFCLPAGLD